MWSRTGCHNRVECEIPSLCVSGPASVPRKRRLSASSLQSTNPHLTAAAPLSSSAPIEDVERLEDEERQNT